MTDSMLAYLSLLPPAAVALTAFAVAAFLISYVAARLLPVLGSLAERFQPDYVPNEVNGDGGPGLSKQELLELENERKAYAEINRVRWHIVAGLLFALTLWSAGIVLMMVAVRPYIPYLPEGILLPNNVVLFGMLIVGAGIGWLAYRWLLMLLAQEFPPQALTAARAKWRELLNRGA